MYFCGVLLMLLVAVAPIDFQLCVLVGQNLKILSITLRRGLRFTCFQCSVASSIACMNFLPSSWLTPAASRQSLIFSGRFAAVVSASLMAFFELSCDFASGTCITREKRSMLLQLCFFLPELVSQTKTL